MKLTEVTRRKDADEQRAQAEGEDMGCHPRIESTDARDEEIPNHRVEESPHDIDRCRGEPLARRFGKGTFAARRSDQVHHSPGRIPPVTSPQRPWIVDPCLPLAPDLKP
jgi:hypothetical protein